MLPLVADVFWLTADEKEEKVCPPKNLKKMGADIEELQDGFIINGPTPLKGTDIETFHDHRIAMAFTIAGLVANGDVVLDHPECASISFPEFYDVLENLKQ